MVKLRRDSAGGENDVNGMGERETVRRLREEEQMGAGIKYTS